MRRGIILRDGPALGLDEALNIAGGKVQGGVPSELSHALPYAGHYILRDGLAPESMGLAFDAGPLGLAHAVKISQKFIGDVPFVMYLGDNLLNKGITHFVQEFDREKPAAIAGRPGTTESITAGM